MKLRALVLLTTLLTLGGCEKVGNWIKSSGKKAPGAVTGPGGPVDPELAAMVQRDGDAVMFRRDLDFPARIDISTDTKTDFKKVTKIGSSALNKGAQRSVLDYSVKTEMLYQKAPGTFDITFQKRNISMFNPNQKTSVVPPGKDLEGHTIKFSLTSNGWRPSPPSGPVNFKDAVWSEATGEDLEKVMAEVGAHPRAQWLSSSRSWRKDDQTVFTGTWLKMLTPYDGSGRVKVVFEEEEAVGGHPCGVFSLQGTLVVEDQVDPDGTIYDSEITIESGKIWASLLYPVLLREEYNTIQTIKISGSGVVKEELRGRIVETKTRRWEP